MKGGHPKCYKFGKTGYFKRNWEGLPKVDEKPPRDTMQDTNQEVPKAVMVIKTIAIFSV